MRVLASRLRFVLSAIAAFTATGAVAADGPPTDEPLEFRLISVASITRGHSDFIPERGPLPTGADAVNDEANPLFGGEGEESWKPYGSVEDVIELAKQRAALGTWDREGFSISSWGQSHLLVRAPKSVLDPLDAYLAGLEADALSTVVIDAMALSGAWGATSSDGGLPGALSPRSVPPRRRDRRRRGSPRRKRP